MTRRKQALALVAWLVLAVAVNAAEAVSPDGKLKAVTDGATIKLVDVATGKEVRVMKSHIAAVTTVAFSPDGKSLASGGLDKSVLVWDLASGKLLWKLQISKAINTVAYSQDGRTLTLTDSDNKPMNAEAATGKLLP